MDNAETKAEIEAERLCQPYDYPSISQNLAEESTVERKIIGMRMIVEKAQQAKLKPNPTLVCWMR